MVKPTIHPSDGKDQIDKQKADLIKDESCVVVVTAGPPSKPVAGKSGCPCSLKLILLAVSILCIVTLVFFGVSAVLVTTGVDGKSDEVHDESGEYGGHHGDRDSDSDSDSHGDHDSDSHEHGPGSHGDHDSDSDSHEHGPGHHDRDSHEHSRPGHHGDHHSDDRDSEEHSREHRPDGHRPGPERPHRPDHDDRPSRPSRPTPEHHDSSAEHEHGGDPGGYPWPEGVLPSQWPDHGPGGDDDPWPPAWPEYGPGGDGPPEGWPDAPWRK